jgi:hypothetical protein
LGSLKVCGRVTAASLVAFGIAVATVATASAQPAVDGSAPAPGPDQQVGQFAAPTSDNADPAAVAACGQFADVLDTTSTYYGDFADALEETAQPDYSDPTISGTNTIGRTALRQGAGVAMEAANTPGLQPDIADPMRSWSLGATKLLIKMGLRNDGQSLNMTANELNNDAVNVQQACACAGTHA